MRFLKTKSFTVYYILFFSFYNFLRTASRSDVFGLSMTANGVIKWEFFFFVKLTTGVLLLRSAGKIK